MKKLELETLQAAFTETTVSDLYTDRQAETIQEMADNGLIRLERSEQLKKNLNLMQFKLGTTGSVKAALEASQEQQQENEQSEQPESETE